MRKVNVCMVAGEAVAQGAAGRIGAGIRELPPRLLLVERAIAVLDSLIRQLDKDAIEIVAGYTDGMPSTPT